MCSEGYPHSHTTILSTGASPPQIIISTSVICSPKVKITWRPPVLESNVIVLQYRAYALLVNSSRDVDHAIGLPATHYEVYIYMQHVISTVMHTLTLQVFHGFQNTGIVTVKETNAVYQMRMSIVVYIAGESVEGKLSEATAESIVSVPKPCDGIHLCIVCAVNSA